MLAALAALLPAAQSTPRSRPTIDWESVKAPFGGHAEALVPHGDLLFVRADSTWWSSTDRGASWQLSSGRLGRTWWIEPLGGDLFIIDLGGIYRTADRGRSWTSCGALARTDRGDVRLIAAGHSLLYWLPKAGLFRSEDRCATWASVPTPWDADPGPVGFVRAPDAGFVLINTLRGWFRTTDEGRTWNSVDGPAGRPLPSASNGRSAIILGKDLVIGTTNGVFRSTDRGLSWSQIGFPGRWARTAVTPDGVIYAALDGGESARALTAVMRSTDAGRTWLSADDGLMGHYIHDLRRDQSGFIYALGDAGVYRLENSGRWQHVGLPRSFPTFLLAAPSGDLYLGLDYAGAYRSQDRGASWRPLLLPHERASAMTVTKRGDLLLASEHGVVRSRDRGDSWEQLDIDEDIRTIFTAPSTGVIVAGTTNSVFRSDDDGVTWVEHAPGAEDVFPESFAEGRNGDLFVGTGGGDVYRLTGVTQPWHQLPSMHDGSPVCGLAVLANGDVLAGTTFALSRWTRGDDGWEELALSREEQPRVGSVILDANNGNLVAATSTAGVFISSDQGRTWIAANRGLATRRIRRMVLGPDGKFYIATDAVRGGGIRIYKGRLVDKGREPTLRREAQWWQARWQD
jgi:photosystem II stability/assembly factor-like uncharacterized protein